MESQYVDGEKMDGCNLHAFCSACTENGGTTINRNCKAMVDMYGKGALYMVTSFFNGMEDFWCTDDVQESITAGTFADTYTTAGVGAGWGDGREKSENTEGTDSTWDGATTETDEEGSAGEGMGDGRLQNQANGDDYEW